MDLDTLLNKNQKEAATYLDSHLRIIAGAGSGKTRVVTYRIAHLIQDVGIDPRSILAITFTNKAAGELKERICAAVPEGGADIWAATFHSTCARILRRYGDRIGYTSHFTVYGTDDQKKLVKDILKQLNIAEKTLPVKSILSEISKAKDKMLTAQIKKALDSTEGADYIFTISVQGHGDYPTEPVLSDPEIKVTGAESEEKNNAWEYYCLLYTSPSPRDCS